MNKFISLILLVTLLSSSTPASTYFVGKIVYKYSFTDLDGKDLSGKMIPLLGREQHYFVDNKNYKALNEHQKYVQLYNSATNSYYYFNNNTAQKFDASLSTSKKAIVVKLDKKERVAGYDCNAIQMETDNATIIYYYSEKIKVDPNTYTKHNFGEWNKYIDATSGALPLKFIMTDKANKYIWTSVASEVNMKKLRPEDFNFPVGYKL